MNPWNEVLSDVTSKAAIDAGLADIAAGRTRPLRDFFLELGMTEPLPAPDPPEDPKIGDEPAPEPPVEDDDGH